MRNFTIGFNFPFLFNLNNNSSIIIIVTIITLSLIENFYGLKFFCAKLFYHYICEIEPINKIFNWPMFSIKNFFSASLRFFATDFTDYTDDFAGGTKDKRKGKVNDG